ncbi:MAG: LL-diaminopimelate aminotransferase [Endomicrobiales bacterium]|nr:LL-diaminopimelate aminotransferase [Endomicrobiales bacterium]
MKKIEPSDKLKDLPPYLFSSINALKAEAYKKKLDVIDLGMGNPDLVTPKHIVERLCDTVMNHQKTHRYPQAKGMPRFRRAVSQWMNKRFNVDIDPNNEIVTLIGSKEGIAHLCTTYIDSGDLALFCDPGYLVHYNGIILAGGQVHRVPLLEENKFLPDLKSIPEEVAKKAKLFFVGYPHNPTTAVVEDKKFFIELIEFCRKYGILLAYDNAYSEVTFDGYRAPSIFEFPGARDVAIEFHSFSKSFNMCGWRIGWACGAKELLYPFENLKSYVDFGVPTFVQLAAVAALEGSQDCIKQRNEIYQRRRDKMVEGLNKMGWNIEPPKATMYLWAKLPEQFLKMGSLAFSEKLIKETGVVVAPGVAFGKYGESYVRMALVTHDNRFHDALLRIKKFIK